MIEPVAGIVNQCLHNKETHMSPIPPCDQLDGIADSISNITESPCLERSLFTTEARISSTSMRVDLDSMTDLHVNTIDTIVVYGAKHSHRIKRECYSCHSKLDFDDQVRCCLTCDHVYCMTCLMDDRAHEEHWNMMHNQRSLREYMEMPT